MDEPTPHRSRVLRGMHRLGVVVGAVTFGVVYSHIVRKVGPLHGFFDFLVVLIVSALAGTFVWLVFLAIGWAIRGFLAD